MEFNKRLERVQIGRHKDVPIETNRSLWLLWVFKDGNWDADSVSNSKSYLETLNSDNVVSIFCVWNGQYRTNLFLMDKQDLIQRLKKNA